MVQQLKIDRSGTQSGPNTQTPLFVLALSIIAALAGMMYYIYKTEVEYNQKIRGEELKCLRAGYPDMKWKGGELFCLRRINGTDEVVWVKQLK